MEVEIFVSNLFKRTLLVSSIFEILLNFFRIKRSQRYYERRKVPTSLMEIGLDYIKFKFWLDIIAIFPLEEINSFFFFTKIFRLRQIIRGAISIGLIVESVSSINSNSR